MTSQKPELLDVSDIARHVAEWIIEKTQGVMDRFRDQDTFFYDEYKAYKKELKQYEQKKRRITKKVFEDKDYQKLITERDKLIKNCNLARYEVHDCEKFRSLSERKLSFDSKLTEDMIDDFDAKCKKEKSDSVGQHVELLERLDKKRKQCTKKHEELKRKSDKEIDKIQKPRPNPLWLLTPPPVYADYESARVVMVFDLDDSELPKFSEKLEKSACYVILTIIHNRRREKYRGTKQIGIDVWTPKEDWIEETWKEITENQHSSDVKDWLTNNNFRIVEADLQKRGLIKKEETKADKEAYIPFKKAIEFSNGILSRKKLEKAIDKGDPIKVRADKPSKQRCNVHIQDVLSLIEKLSANDDTKEKAIQMFAEWKMLYKSKQPDVNLD